MKNILLTVIALAMLAGCEAKKSDKIAPGKWVLSNAGSSLIIYAGATSATYRIRFHSGEHTVKVKLNGNDTETLTKGQTMDVEARFIELKMEIEQEKNHDEGSVSGTYERINTGLKVKE